MLRHSIVILVNLLVTFSLSAGCKNSNHCAGNPNDDCRLDAGSGDSCTGNVDCTSSSTPVCDVTGSMTCVQCLPDQADACAGTTPVCGDDHACTECTSHAQCTTSEVCLPDGSCAEEGDVAYVGGSGATDNDQCTMTVPCTKVSKALATSRTFVKFSGTTNEQVTLTNRNVTFLADPGAKLTDMTNGILVRIDGTSEVAIYDLEVSGASGASNPGISLQPGNTASLSLRRVTISGNQGGGITTSGGSLTISQSTISSNQGGGIIMATAGAVDITNSFIHHNGNTVGASAGGLSLRPMVGSKVEFNTIIDNQANLGAASAGGVFCDTNGFIAANNLIFRNTGGPSGNVQTFGNCMYGNSFNMPGSGASDNTPAFANPNSEPYDYHLTTSSPSSVLDAAGACSTSDFDGEARPAGGACDLGADERTVNFRIDTIMLPSKDIGADEVTP